MSLFISILTLFFLLHLRFSPGASLSTSKVDPTSFPISLTKSPSSVTTLVNGTLSSEQTVHSTDSTSGSSQSCVPFFESLTPNSVVPQSIALPKSPNS